MSQIQASYPTWSANVQTFLLNISSHVSEYSKHGFEQAIEKSHQLEDFLNAQLLANGIQKDQAQYITYGVLSLVVLALLFVTFKIISLLLRLVFSIFAFVFCCSWARSNKNKKVENKKKPEPKKETTSK